MSSPFPNNPLTIPPLPSFPSIFNQPSAFSSGQQSTLQNFANALGGFSSSIQGSGAQDLWNTEQTLQSNNTTLNTVIANVLNLNPLLGNSNSVTTLNTIVTSPNINNFITSILSDNSVITNLASLGGNTSFFNNISTIITAATDPAGYIKQTFAVNSIYNNVTPQNLITALLFPPGNANFPNSLGANFAEVFTQLFSKSLAGNTSPYQLMYDMFTNAGNVPKDFQDILQPGFPDFFTTFFSNTNSVLPNGSTAQKIITDLLGKTGFQNTLFDILNTLPVSTVGNNPAGWLTNVGFGNWLFAMVNNIGAMPDNIFLGSPAGTGTGGTGIGIHIPAIGGSSYTGDFVNWNGTGYLSSVTPASGMPSTPIPGQAGFIIAALTAAFSGMNFYVNNVWNGDKTLSNSATLINGIEHMFCDFYLLSLAVLGVFGMVGQIASVLQNIGNIQNNSSIPINPGAFVNNYLPSVTRPPFGNNNNLP